MRFARLPLLVRQVHRVLRCSKIAREQFSRMPACAPQLPIDWETTLRDIPGWFPARAREFIDSTAYYDGEVWQRDGARLACCPTKLRPYAETLYECHPLARLITRLEVYESAAGDLFAAMAVINGDTAAGPFETSRRARLSQQEVDFKMVRMQRFVTANETLMPIQMWLGNRAANLSYWPDALQPDSWVNKIDSAEHELVGELFNGMAFVLCARPRIPPGWLKEAIDQFSPSITVDGPLPDSRVDLEFLCLAAMALPPTSQFYTLRGRLRATLQQFASEGYFRGIPEWSQLEGATDPVTSYLRGSVRRRDARAPLLSPRLEQLRAAALSALSVEGAIPDGFKLEALKLAGVPRRTAADVAHELQAQTAATPAGKSGLSDSWIPPVFQT